MVGGGLGEVAGDRDEAGAGEHADGALGGDVEVRGQFGAVDGDEVLLRQSFSNVLRNAVEACAGASVAPVIVVQSEIDAAQNVSRIAVTDNGPGIPPEKMEDVFKPFVRLEASRSRATGGIGLGLAIARSIVLAHGGDLVLANRAEGGLRAEIRLPKAEAG